MATLRIIDATHKPSPFSNHVLIEEDGDGYHMSGASNVNHYVTHLSKRIKTRDDAVREAMRWALENGIPEVCLVEAVNRYR